jgi:3-keto-disaccharide hydrolase
LAKSSGFVTQVLVLIVSIAFPFGITEAQTTPSVNVSLDSSKNQIDTHGYMPIFDETTLNGWSMAGESTFSITDENALQSAGQGIFWYKKKKFENFVLELDWKVSNSNDNSGVFVRFSDPGNDPKTAVKSGYEIQIDDGAGNPLHQTGAIYDFSAPAKMVSNPPGQWNSMKIEVVNQFYTISINEEKVNDFIGDRLETGYIGLQSHDDESKVAFRNITVKEIF